LGCEKAPVDCFCSFSKSSCSSLGRRGGAGPPKREDEWAGEVLNVRARGARWRGMEVIVRSMVVCVVSMGVCARSIDVVVRSLWTKDMCRVLAVLMWDGLCCGRARNVEAQMHS
jgi:hypothetical protein